MIHDVLPGASDVKNRVIRLQGGPDTGAFTRTAREDPGDRRAERPEDYGEDPIRARSRARLGRTLEDRRAERPEDYGEDPIRARSRARLGRTLETAGPKGPRTIRPRR